MLTTGILPRRRAIALAILVMWLVGGISLGLLHSLQHWSFFLLGGYDIATLGQIGGYYLARFGSQIPALAIAAIIISLSEFRRPPRVACFTAFAYHGVMVAIRVARNPWSAAPNLDQTIPVLAEVLHLILMVLCIGAFTQLCPWVFRFLRGFRGES